MLSERRPLLVALALALVLALSGSRPAAAAAGEPYRVHALVGAEVVVSPERTLARATVVVRDGVIEAVGADLRPPADARIWDLSGKTLYPGFLDAWVPASALSGEARKRTDPRSEDEDLAEPRETPKAAGASHELPWVHPERDTSAIARLAADAVARYRDLGFVAAQVVPDDGILRGTAAVIALGEGSVNRQIYRARAAAVAAFETETGEYPNSLMGTIAVLRQTFLDARWYAQVQERFARRPLGRERPETSLALAALGPAVGGTMPVVIDALADPLNVLRAAALARELGLTVQVVATGGEYKRLAEVRAGGLPLILPLDFPEPPAAGDDPAEWDLVPTEALRHWRRAPGNPRWLAEAGVRFALTAAKLGDSPAPFADKLRAAVEAGLPRRRALAALTTVPAEMLGVAGLLGTIEKGKAASFVVARGDLFGDDGAIERVWVDGRPYEPRAKPDEGPDPAGAWAVRFGPAARSETEVLEISREGGGWKGRITAAGTLRELRCVEVAGRRLVAELAHRQNALLGVDFTADTMVGFLDTAGGALAVRGERVSGGRLDRPRVTVPAAPPAPEGGPLATPPLLVVRNATVWTAGPAGTIAGADLVVAAGKVQAVGRGLYEQARRATPSPYAGAMVIDAAGKHVSPGLIDAHSHTAISGFVNEGTHAVTAEVRIGDVGDSEDWNLYSELAGGLTAANQLHGSANPIGGQSQTIKLRWGSPPEGLKLEGAMPGIKFALGENVKQSNWGDRFTRRYPQTRLGVEEVMRERFLAARDYRRKWDEYRQQARTDPDALPPRTDLQLETLGEILRGERLIHCHSYRQDEILMLLRLCEELGIRIGTFQHGLETYKVADEVAAHGAGASIFSDWWAYKIEVYDAIPYAGALLWDRGVVVSFNSDSNEQARRLNSEAAKVMKYGGLPEEEAIKLVTINPAMQLRIDRRVGSLEPGKDADFVIWNGPPLSSMSRAEETWIDGRKYFDRGQDLERRAGLETERNRLVAAARAAAKAGKPEARAGTGYRPRTLEDGVSQGARCLEGAAGEAGR